LDILFSGQWFWLVIIIIGLLLVLLELAVGIETGLDLVFIGSAFVAGGLITWPFSSWVITVIVTSIICIAYIALGRRYIHRLTAVQKYQTNVDAIIGRTGVVLKPIEKNVDGIVKVDNEEWKARAGVNINPGEQITVLEIKGVTLIVEKFEGSKMI
jgi:inner membrane protein